MARSKPGETRSLLQQTLQDFLKNADSAPVTSKSYEIFKRPTGKRLDEIRDEIDAQKTAEIEAHRLKMLGENIAKRNLMLKKREENREKAILRKEASLKRLQAWGRFKAQEKKAKLEELKAFPGMRVESTIEPTEQEKIQEAQASWDELNAEREAGIVAYLRANGFTVKD